VLIYSVSKKQLSAVTQCNKTCFQYLGFPRLLESPGIVFENFPGSRKSVQGRGKSWNLLGSVDAVMRMQTPEYVHPHSPSQCATTAHYMLLLLLLHCLPTPQKRSPFIFPTNLSKIN